MRGLDPDKSKVPEIALRKIQTSRAANRLLDACKVDIANVPLLIQCKSGYIRNRPKADVVFREMKEELAKNYPAKNPIHSYPPILVHKISNRKDNEYLVTMQFKDWIKFLEAYAEKNSEIFRELLE
jgi:hypothetical protein